MAQDPVASFCERVRAELARRPGDLDACAHELGALARGDVWRALVDRHLDALLADPGHAIPRSGRSDWVLAREEGFTLTLVAAPRETDEVSPLLHGSPRPRLLVGVGVGPFAIERYRHDVACAPDVLDRTATLTALGRERIEPGQVVALAAFRELAEPALHREPTFFLELAGAPVSRVAWVYARDGLRPHAAVAVDLADARLEYAVWTLVELGHPDAAAAIAGLYEHPAHQVRWTAVRALLEVDRGAGAALLRRATADPHPHVAAAARRGLAALDP